MLSVKRFSLAGTSSAKTLLPATTVYSLTGDGSDGDGFLLRLQRRQEGLRLNAYRRGVAEADATPPASSEVTAVDAGLKLMQLTRSSCLLLPQLLLCVLLGLLLVRVLVWLFGSLLRPLQLLRTTPLLATTPLSIVAMATLIMTL